MEKITRTMADKQKKQYGQLSKKEKKIYDSVIRYFPATSHDSALNAAWVGGVRFNFMPT